MSHCGLMLKFQMRGLPRVRQPLMPVQYYFQKMLWTLHPLSVWCRYCYFCHLPLLEQQIEHYDHRRHHERRATPLLLLLLLLLTVLLMVLLLLKLVLLLLLLPMLVMMQLKLPLELSSHQRYQDWSS